MPIKTVIVPDSIKTDEDKLEYYYRAQELLRLEHNVNGARFRDKEITLTEWEAYLRGDFNPKNQALSEALAPLKDAKVQRISTDRGIPIKEVDIIGIKEPLKESTRYDTLINLGGLVS